MQIEERVGRLERENRRLKAGGGLVLLLLGSVFLLGQASPDVIDEIKARRISIYDENGKVRATLRSEGLSFYDENGKLRAEMDQTYLSFYDADDKARAGMSARTTNNAAGGISPAITAKIRSRGPSLWRDSASRAPLRLLSPSRRQMSATLFRECTRLPTST